LINRRAVCKLPKFQLLKLDGNQICAKGIDAIKALMAKHKKEIGGNKAIFLQHFCMNNLHVPADFDENDDEGEDDLDEALGDEEEDEDELAEALGRVKIDT
jgi:hypothetical protein